jgi:hypothetical protein
MAATLNILLFLAMIAFSLNLGCSFFGANSLADPAQCSTPLNDILTNGYGAIYTQFWAILIGMAALGLAGAIAVGTFSFPNPYAIFGLLTLAIVQLAILPASGFALLGVPALYNSFLVGVFDLGWLFAALSGYRVGD